MRNAWRRSWAFVCSVPRADWWALALVLSVTGLLCSVVYRVYTLQTKPDTKLAAFMNDYYSKITEPGRRGSIFDRRGRLISSSHFGKTLAIDPVEFPGRKWKLDDAIPALAKALEVEPGEIGPRIAKMMAHNDEVWRAAGADLSPGKPRPSMAGLHRYLHLGPPVLSDRQLEAVDRLMTDKTKRMVGITLEHRAVRDRVADELVAPIVGLVGLDNKTGEPVGKFGIEKRVDDKGIEPTDGALRYVRDARNNPLWVPEDGYTPPKRGDDVVLSIDLDIQKMVAEELQRGADDVDAAGARCVLVDVDNGDILAMLDITRDIDAKVYDFATFIPKQTAEVKTSGVRYRVINPAEKGRDTPETKRNRCVEDIYEPGSIFKPFMWSTVLDLGRASLKESFETQGPWQAPDGRTLRDVTKKSPQTLEDILVNSSNIGMVKITSRLSPQEMQGAVVAFGFGRKTGVEVSGESRGQVTPLSRWRTPSHVSNAIGHEVAVTPLQMVRGFTAFCRNGDQAGTITDVGLIAGIGETGASQRTSQRVISAKTALTTRETMRGVTHKVDERLEKVFGEKGWRYELFGKSGTAQIPITGGKVPKGSNGYFTGQYFSSFIAGGPVERPRLAILVTIDDPAPSVVKANEYYGSKVAGPVARRVMERALAYLGVPASPPPSADDAKRAHGGD